VTDSNAMTEHEDSPLTPMQERFCEEYIVDLNATAAAKRAGYSAVTANQQGPRLLVNVGISARISELKNMRSRRTNVTADFVLSTIVETIDRCRQAEPVMEFDRATKSMVPTGDWKFEHQGVLKGCELLGRHLKLYTDKVEHSGKIDDISEAELDRKIEEKMLKLKGVE
jgi:phage terminase small subunit